MSSICIFYITVPNQEEGEAIAKALLNEKLIACANILPPHLSLYTWKGEIQSEKEHVLILKTQNKHQELIEERVKKLHPYDCPCILAIQPSYSSKEFAQWIDSTVKS